MKEILPHIDKLLENKYRLAIMAALMKKPGLTFNEIKDALGLTDGNLSSNTILLEERGYIETDKRFVGRRPLTTYRLTNKGYKAFAKHCEQLAKVISGQFSLDEGQSDSSQ
ncbi:DNA-binding MarR family transcriptional regulator [Thermonema lapsum]|jgi:DNA-binding MarR family transcriptional regulator|uniref:DNA-binding MarR family transcriptional regulator n=1 Tax=Thermonema lapsum TaxID=28195 RepID=A0A846MNA2_9BACT|nr:transcriptional regulator [Thermonema lapsum]NIK72925.1 DNA-binding MarR family transcriptional regulator [Thermonema lapsum]